MSAVNLPARGFGPSAAIKFVVTRGYIAGAPAVATAHAGYGGKTETPEEAERLWRESHRRFDRKEYDRLKKAEIAAADRADAVRNKKQKEALQQAADATAEIAEVAEPSQVQDLTRYLNEAASAVRAKEAIEQAQKAVALAHQIAMARRLADEQDEEDALSILLL